MVGDEWERRADAVVIDGDAPLREGLNAYMTKVFGLMFFGLLLTALAAGGFIALLAVNEAARGVAQNSIFLFGMIIAELALVIAISAGLGKGKMRASAARLMFCLYAVVNGVTLSYVLLAYASAPWAITRAFLMAAVFFGTMCVYGMVTKADLTSTGRIFTAGLFALLIATVVNLFLRSSGLDFILCLAGVAVFTGLTAYDTQKLKELYLRGVTGEDASKAAVFGALALYLDFINLFLYLLRALGRNK